MVWNTAIPRKKLHESACPKSHCVLSANGEDAPALTQLGVGSVCPAAESPFKISFACCCHQPPSAASIIGSVSTPGIAKKPSNWSTLADFIALQVWPIVQFTRFHHQVLCTEP